MNTTTAAIQAHVTVATIRTWCRNGIIAATKTAGRWIISAASLAHRIAIGAMKRPARQETRPVLDLTAVTIKSRTRPTGETITRVSGYSALLTDKLNAIADAGDRAHAREVLNRTDIILSDTPDPEWDKEFYARHAGLSRTTYRGGLPTITIADVLDLADEIRAQLSA
ncbi:hypothetical protein AB0903_29110 [Streptomyces sp. NPDC048389]|uniref:hypothetical protein n=1 Tax=Streptomyces sp. NPDC048389 TaxID=3154622 RepID=UPI00345529E3